MRGRRSGTAALMALGAVVAAACQPVVTPTPTPPQVTSCGETITAPDGKTQYFAIVDDGIGAPEAVTFDAATQAEKQADVAQIEAADGPVIAVEVDRIVRAAVNPNPADDPQYVNQWGVDAAGFPTAWDGSHAGSQGANTGVPVRVAVLDTGVYRAHEDLGTSAVVPGIDEVGTGDATSDPNGHGTHVAGILGARDNIVGGVGGAPDIEIFPIRVLNAQGSGSYAGVINGINDAVNIAHAKVISMSLGGGGFSQGLQDAVNAAVAAGIVVFAAAGNDGTCAANYPAALTGVLSVAATVQPGTSLAS